MGGGVGDLVLELNKCFTAPR